MALLPNRTLARNAFSALTLLPVLALPVLLSLFPPDGGEGAQWVQFIGRFHPLAVHLPIALVLLVPVLELAGRNERFSHLRLSTPFVLGIALISGIVAALLGWCLGRNGGFSGTLISSHMWAGAILLALCWICFVSRTATGSVRSIYPFALAAAVIAVAWTGYRGGQLSFGENHLTEFMPPSLRSLLHIVEPSEPDSQIGGPNTFYGARIQPIFSAQCLSCHSAAKRKGGLQLTSYAALMKGGKHGAAVKPGNAGASDLLRRLSLPPTDDDFMPKGGKPPLSPDQIKLVGQWIAAGASGTAPPESIPAASVGAGLAVPAEVKFPDIDPAEVAKERAGGASALAVLQRRFPGILEYESRNSADLELNASLMADKFGDNELTALAPLASQIVVADFSRTAITDHSAAAIGGMKRLRVLRLMHTHIGDDTLKSLEGMDQLESLSVFGTAVTPASLPVVEQLPHLKHFYAGQTAIKAGSSIPVGLKEKVSF
jgi:uncharacterized membrane protein/mono/diheme cytochrome c family protein